MAREFLPSTARVNRRRYIISIKDGGQRVLAHGHHDVHNTSKVLFRLGANIDPQRDSILTKGPADILDHPTSEIAMGTKLGIDATRKLAGEGFKRAWPP